MYVEERRVRLQSSVSANLTGNNWTATLYNSDGDEVITAGQDKNTGDKYNTYARYTIDGILEKAAGKYVSLGTVALKDLGKNNLLADVDINNVDLFNHTINIDVTDAKKADVKATIGNDYVYSNAEHGTDVTYTNALTNAHDFVDETAYALNADATTFAITGIGAHADESVTFNNTTTTFVDGNKDKYAAQFTAANLDLSESTKKDNNLVYVKAPTVELTTAGVDVKTGKGNDVVLFGSAPTVLDGRNTIDYVGGVDAYQGSDGKEVYSVKAMDKDTALIVNDLGGANDELDFSASGATLQKMTFFFDVYMDGMTAKTSDDSLSILNWNSDMDAKSLANILNTGKGVVEIDNYFNEDSEFAHGDGYIETIKTAGSNVGVNMDAKVAAIAENVAAWLDNNGNYDSAMDVIAAGNEADIKSLMLCYSAGTVA